MADAQQALLVVIAGPTGSGKSDLALYAAQLLGGEVVNCDSLQIYRHFDIGTAKLRPEERRGIPHHLIDILEPDQIYSAGAYARAAREVVREISARGRIPIVAGGTGFYLRALLEGISPGPARDEELRCRLLHREQKRKGGLHRLLRRLDPEAARRIHENDLNKTLRALELRLIRRARGETLERPDPLTGFRVLKIGLDPDRSWLYERLNQRMLGMFESGLIEEVQSLLASGINTHAKPFESLGYKETVGVIQGRMTREEAITAAQTATRQYAKRQLTWFRREANMHWLNGFGDDPAIQAQVSSLIRSEIS